VRVEPGATAGHPGCSAGRAVVAGAVCAAWTVLFAAGAGVLAIRTGFGESTYPLLPFTASCGLLGGLLVALRPGNPVSWGFALTGGLFALGQFADQHAIYGLITRPGSVPGARVALWIQSLVYEPALALLFVIVPLYFPDGRLPSRRWRWMVRSCATLMIINAVLTAFVPADILVGDSMVANPYGIGGLHSLGWLTDWALSLILLGLVVAAVGSLVLRFRRAEGEPRQQIKWLAYAFVLVTVGFGIDASVALAAPARYPAVFPVIQVLPVAVVAAAAVAILRHRLFDIDRLINRTLVYGTLTTCLATGYVLAVGWLGTVFRARGNTAVALVATGLVAVAFAPLRDRLQRLVNRVLYGDRDDPYRVLTLLGRRLEATLAHGAVLPTVVDTVSEALKLPYVAVEVGGGGRFVTAAEHGRRPPDRGRLLYLELTHAGEDVGRLVLGRRGQREDFSAADRQVLDDLVRRIGAAVHAVRLSADLQRSREQLVVAREEERRRVGRDLHDGLGPQLASLSMKVETARELIDDNPHRARQLLSELLEQTASAVEDVRRVAHQLRPPVLDALGLLAALRVHAGDQQPTPVHLDLPPRLPPLTAALEVAAYHIALEALRNAASHAGATRRTLRVHHDGAALHVEVADDGSGIPTGHHVGVGLSSMRERALELGGSCTFEAPPGGGTLVRAVLPHASAAQLASDQGA
jgi:signal transduction histidine kinase